MKILVYCYEYPPIGGGAGNAAQHLCEAWAGQGHEVRIVTSRHAGASPVEMRSNVTIIRLDVARKSLSRGRVIEMIRFMTASWGHAGRMPDGQKPDISVVFMPIPSGMGALRLQIKSRVPMISLLRGGDVPGFDPDRLGRHHLLTAPLIRYLWDRSAGLVANSKGLAGLAAAFDPSKPIQVIPNGVDIGIFERAALTDVREGLDLVFAGRFAETQKNISVILKACAGLPRVRLCLIGDGPDRGSIKQMIDRLGMKERVRLTGWIDKREMAGIFSRSHVYVSASKWEGMPNAVLEAMASGLPLVLSKAAGHEDLVEEGRNGRLFKADDPTQLTAVLESLIGDPSILADYGAHSRDLAVRRHSWDAIAREYLDLFAKVMTGPITGRS